MRNVTETRRKRERERLRVKAGGGKTRARGGGDSTESQRVESSNHNFDGDNLSTVLTVLLFSTVPCFVLPYCCLCRRRCARTSILARCNYCSLYRLCPVELHK